MKLHAMSICNSLRGHAPLLLPFQPQSFRAEKMNVGYIFSVHRVLCSLGLSIPPSLRKRVLVVVILLLLLSGDREMNQSYMWHGKTCQCLM